MVQHNHLATSHESEVAEIDATEITLDYPIEAQGVTHRVITIRPPTAEDARQARRGNVTRYARGMALAAIVTGCRPDLLRKMDPVDASKIDEFLLRHSV